MLQRYLLVWLTLLSLLAFAWPTWICSTFDPFAASAPILSYLFSATMFAIGCLLPPAEIQQVLRRWPTVLGGTAIQYSIMPLLAYSLGHAFGLSGDMLIGVILVGCVPGAMASNVLTLTARGNISYSVSLTTMATLLSPVIVPATLYLTLRLANIDAAGLAERAFWFLLTQVVGPVLAGHYLARKSPWLEGVMSVWGPVIANLTILWIIAVVINRNHDKLAHAAGELVAVLLAINLLGYLAGFGGGLLLRLPDRMRRALTLEVGMQNAGLGSLLACQLFEGRETTELPPALYMFGCMLTGTILAQFWASQGQPASDDEQPGPQPSSSC